MDLLVIAVHRRAKKAKARTNYNPDRKNKIMAGPPYKWPMGAQGPPYIGPMGPRGEGHRMAGPMGPWPLGPSSSIQGPMGPGPMGAGPGAGPRPKDLDFFISHEALGTVYLASPGNLLFREPVDISFGAI